MKKVNFVKAGVILAAALALISLGTCNQIITDNGSGRGGGEAKLRVVFDFSGKLGSQGTQMSASAGGLPPMLTVHPIISDDIFDSYKLKFEPSGSGGEAAEYDVVDANIDPVSGIIDVTVTLTVGTYTVIAEAYKNSEVIARGKKESVGVSSGSTADANITMAPDVTSGGKGNFSYSITIPAGATGKLTLKNNIMQAVDGVNDVNLNAGQATSGTINDLNVGFYYVAVALTDTATSYAAGLVEVLHIYKGLTADLTKTYTEADFAPPKVVSDFDLSSYFSAPVTDAEPVRTFGTSGSQYTGTIQWKASSSNFDGNKFAASTVYTAVVTLEANAGYIFNGVGADAFIHSNAETHGNNMNSGVVTFIFAATGAAQSSLNVTVGFGYDPIEVTGAGGTIYKNSTPDSLTLSVSNYENHAWYIDGDIGNPKNGNPLTLNAADYAEGAHTASFTGTRNEIPYSKSVSFTVADGQGGGGGGGQSISFATEDYVSQTEAVLDGWSASNWILNAGEYNKVYFAVNKPAGSTITVGGTDAAKVTQANSGESVAAVNGGLSATDTLAVFTVDTGNLLFDGGSRSFTLGDVAVTVNVTPNLTGAAVFKADEQTLTRLDDTSGFTAFTSFLPAIEWVDRNAEANTEYLIRVEKDETSLPRIFFIGNNQENVTVRLRGHGTARVLKCSATLQNDNDSYNSTVIATKPDWPGEHTPNGAFINVGYNNGNAAFNKKISFILDNSIVVKGSINEVDKVCQSLISVSWNATLVLRAGALITNYYSNMDVDKMSPVLVETKTFGEIPVSTNDGKVRIEGGSITNCIFDTTYSRLIYFNATDEEFSPGSFYKAANTTANPVVLSNNTANTVCFAWSDDPDHNLTDAELSLPAE
jgi:hypothetical protein